MTNNVLPKHDFTLIVEDVRNEKGNKISLMGVYGDEIVVESLPALLAKICFFTQISGGEGEHQIKVSLKDPDENDIFMNMNEQTLPLKERTGNKTNIVYAVAPFQLQKEGKYVYSIFLNGTEFSQTAFSVKKGVIS